MSISYVAGRRADLDSGGDLGEVLDLHQPVRVPRKERSPPTESVVSGGARDQRGPGPQDSPAGRAVGRGGGEGLGGGRARFPAATSWARVTENCCHCSRGEASKETA